MVGLLGFESGRSIDSECGATSGDCETTFSDRVASILDPSINQLFSVTMRLTALATEQTDARAANRLLGAVHDIDEAIRRLRSDLITELEEGRTTCDDVHVSWE